MQDTNRLPTGDIAHGALEAAADRAARQIPPLWPLASSVAVNPFLGQTTQTLAETGARLARLGGTPVTMPRSWYRERIAAGTIKEEDLAAALEASPHSGRPADLKTLRACMASGRLVPDTLPTIAELAARADGVDWPGIISDRFGLWAGGYLDQGQALWAAPRGRSAWSAWCAYATHDLTPEIMGLKGFAAFVADAPKSPGEAIVRAARRLGLTDAGLDSYFHQLLLSLGGWAQYARYELWRAELAAGTDSTLTDMLAIRLLWEEALLARNEATIGSEWAAVRRVHETPIVPTRDDVVDEILQEAAERAAQRELVGTLKPVSPTAVEGRPAMQAAFCIDVRSEVFRRALESVNPSIRTLGFAGFFGISTRHRRFASDVEECRLPVLLNPAVSSASGREGQTADDLGARYRARAKRAWGRFKLAAVSSFAFVEAMGPVYIGKLLRDGLSLSGHSMPNDPLPRFVPELDVKSRITAAETVLRAMSLTGGFARIVLLVGHGARVANNPHASGLQCGACGGYSGDVNVRLLAGLLNDPRVRAGLVERGIMLPDDTLLVGALHDTTTDLVTIYEDDVAAENHASDLIDIRKWLEVAGKLARGERALRLPRASDERDIAIRARNWAEVRPEWGLAGCGAFIAAPRNRTAGRSLEGRAFLHDYDWRQDEERSFAVLELIMTAPVVVASWISLQYYGSTVAPETYGAGNKLLHNVVGGIGVFEGNGGLLRAGLPLQSIHDGETYTHDPLRLSVCIEAPREAMSEVLARHEGVRALFDNRWLHLFALDDQGRIAWRYAGGLEWQPVETGTKPVYLEAVA
ncbi:YbcC family protein [Jiella pelagia]|uniref:YbcC family protein n=1 Tax=Jiella pelagia TaxID=2986949 RepID=UPI0038B27F7C